MKLLQATLLLLLPTLSAIGEERLTGTLETIDGGLRLLTVSGTDREQGFTEGYWCAEEIHELFTGFALRNAFVRSPYMWEHTMIPKTKERVTVPEYLRERARGILEGMRSRDPKTLYIEDLRRDLGVDDLVAAAALPDFVGLMCSSFTTWREKGDTHPATTWVGRNLDYYGTEALTRNLMIIVRGGGDGRNAWVSIGYPGLAGCLTGVSDQGIFVAIHDVPAFGRNGDKMTPRIVALEEVMRKATAEADVAGTVKSILDGYHYGMAGNCMLSWRGGGAVLELDGQKKDDRVTLRRAGDRRFIACSNHFRKRHDPAKCWRYDRIWEGLENGAPSDLEKAWKLLRSASKEDTLYRVVTNLESGIMELERRKTPMADWHDTARFNFWKLIERAGKVVEPRPVPAEKPRKKAKLR